MTSAIIEDLLGFLTASPTPFHCVTEAARRLEAAGYARLDERAEWALTPGARHYVVRGGGSVLAFRLGSDPATTAGFRIIGAHTDSPNLRLKPGFERRADGYVRADVEIYGGAILATWVDRDLGLAGRVVVEVEGRLEERLSRIDRPIGRIPTVAIHLDRKVNEEGLKLDKHRDLGPTLAVVDTDGEDSRRIAQLVATEAGAEVGALRGHDLCFFDLQGPTLGGLDREMLLSARLDNQAMCHAGLAALLAAGGAEEPPASTAVVALFDHEEVGSGSARGAAGPFLRDALTRIAGADGLARAVAGSLLVSADMAHGVHPSRPDLHDGENLPRLNGGPVIKTHVGQRYATDAATGAALRRLAARLEIPVQEFVVRQDIPCGSTIGPISAAGLGMPTVDVGNAMLSMHSIREMAGAGDPARMTALMSAFLQGE
jgi:aspartyl aminopeptidase